MESSVPKGRLSLYYLAYFGALGALLPYLGPYLKHQGFDAQAIGELMGLLMGARIAAPFLAGWLADRTGRAMGVVRWMSALAALCSAGMLVGRSYGWLALVMTTFSFCWAAALPPFETVTLKHLGRYPERYGTIRLWGSVGFVVAVLVVGPLLERFGLGLLPAIGVGVLAAVAVGSLIVPDHPGAGGEVEVEGLGSAWRSAQVVALLVITLLVQASHGPYYAFYSIHLEAHGYTRTLVGVLWAVGVLAEVGIFLAMTRLLPGVGTRWLLLGALLLTVVRWALIGCLVDWLSVVILAQLLHAASFGLIHAVAIHYVQHHFRGAHQARGQALYAGISFGLGGALGTWASGQLWTLASPEVTFLAAAALPALGFVLALIWVREDLR